MHKTRAFAALEPTPRLIVFALISTLFTLSSSWWAVLASFVAALGILIAGGEYPRAPLTGAISAFILTFLGNALFAGSDVILSLWIFRVSPESLLNGLRLGFRIAAMILPAIAFIAVTPLKELRDAFRGLRIPPAADMYLTIMLRYVDILWYDIQITMKAMAVRGVDWEGGVRDKVAGFRRLMLPLIFRILEHVEAQSLAIDNRGGVLTKRETPSIETGTPAVLYRNVFVLDSDEEKDILRDINIEVEHGKTTALLGPSGSGKSSMLLLCTGLIPHSIGRMKGEVEVYGLNTKNTPLSKLGRLSRIVFPSAVQGLVGLTVEDELAISLRVSTLSHEDYRRAMVKALEAVGLDESFLPRTTLGLSGGEMQRVALASAIVARPRLLALDEVTVQLDPRGKQEVISALQSLMDQSMTTVISDPHVPLLDQLGDHFVRLDAGRVSDADIRLTRSTLDRARLRVPQMWQLGHELGIDLPMDVPQAAARISERLPPAAEPRPEPIEGPTANGEPILQGRNLSYTYPDGPTALRGVDLDLRPGEFVAVLGSNGSGKTTLALLLAGALEATRGELFIRGQPAKGRRRAGVVTYVFQEPTNQIVSMTVADELAFGPKQLGWDDQRVQANVQREMERFHLEAEAVPLRLRAADTRKVAIAATLTMEPAVVILDEPTNNLDEGEVDRLMIHLQSLQRAGTAIVTITHDVEIACRFAERALVMSEGKVLVDGPTREVMARPAQLIKSDVVVPPVTALSLHLWPDEPPALTVQELASWFTTPVAC